MATRFHSTSARVNGKGDWQPGGASRLPRGVPPQPSKRLGSDQPAHHVSPAVIRAFHGPLVRWYHRHHRELPWRATHDPYKIWVSEIMLQQTRVDVVRGYYRRWIRAFPTIPSLARVPYGRVLKLWEGLGYYSRARNFHLAAKLIVRDHRGKLPRAVDALMKLPGVGRYTAGAIASIAFGRRVPLVDGNVMRVFARVFGIRADVTKPSTRESCWVLAAEILPSRDPGTFNQALMELGALICTPSNPRCAVCPLRRVCLARANGQQDDLPNRGRKHQPQPVTHDAAWIRRNGRILLRRRPAHGLLAGMWELPPLETARHRPPRPVLTLRHAITNKRITLRVFACKPSTAPTCNGRLRWASRTDLARLTLPAAHRRAVERLGWHRR